MQSPKNIVIYRVARLFLIIMTFAGGLVACGEQPSTTSTPLAPVVTASSTSPAVTSSSVNPTSTTVASQATTGNTTPTPGQAVLTTVAATINKANGQQQPMTIELARTQQEQETGLMGRTSLPPDRGMLFVFPQTGLVGFWMKDTLMALSIAFITEDGKIIDIQDMEAMSETIHKPNQSYRYALEVPKGYFTSKGIKPGDIFVFNKQ